MANNPQFFPQTTGVLLREKLSFAHGLKMLTDKEKERVIRNIGLCSILNPVTVDVKRRELKRDLPQWKELLLKLSFWGLVFNAIYKIIGFLYIILWAMKETPVWEIIIHLTLAEASPLVAFWYYILFNSSPEVHATVVKLTLGSSKNAGNKERRGYKDNKCM